MSYSAIFLIPICYRSFTFFIFISSLNYDRMVVLCDKLRLFSLKFGDYNLYFYRSCSQFFNFFIVDLKVLNTRHKRGDYHFYIYCKFEHLTTKFRKIHNEFCEVYFFMISIGFSINFRILP